MGREQGIEEIERRLPQALEQNSISFNEVEILWLCHELIESKLRLLYKGKQAFAAFPRMWLEYHDEHLQDILDEIKRAVKDLT